MQIVLFRHGPAEDRDPRRWPDDARRPLTRPGREVTQAACDGLRSIDVVPTRILSSPALRALDTAKIAAKQLARSAPLRVEPWPELSFDGDPSAALRRLGSDVAPTATVLAAGHEPGLGQLLGLLVYGEALGGLRLRRAGAALVEVPRRLGPGAGRLEWVLTRRQLVALATAAS
jgi:phosphohistidine phosphatase